MTYIEELVAAGLPLISFSQGVTRYGLPIAVLRECALLVALFQQSNPDLALVFVDDDHSGNWEAVCIPETS